MAAVVAPVPANQPLPVNPFHPVHSIQYHDTYAQCLQRESQTDFPKGRVYAHCLEYLVLEAPGDTAQTYIAREILECRGDRDKLDDLAEFYINNLFCLCTFFILA